MFLSTFVTFILEAGRRVCLCLFSISLARKALCICDTRIVFPHALVGCLFFLYFWFSEHGMRL